MNTHFESKRQFKIWRYLVSHRQLLLRSVPTDQDPLRIEVLFNGVYAMKTTTQLEKFSVRLATSDEIATIDLDIGASLSKLGLTAFVTKSAASSGYVVAAGFRTAEDNGNYMAPSSLLIEG